MISFSTNRQAHTAAACSCEKHNVIFTRMFLRTDSTAAQQAFVRAEIFYVGVGNPREHLFALVRGFGIFGGSVSSSFLTAPLSTIRRSRCHGGSRVSDFWSHAAGAGVPRNYFCRLAQTGGS